MNSGSIYEKLKNTIETQVIVKKQEGAKIVAKNSGLSPWIFDFRIVLFDADFLNLVAELFWQTYEKKYPFQVGGLETVSLPLITAIILNGRERGTPVNGFYIRKSRKPDGLQKIIEGKLTDEPIILIDDLINSGGTFLKQIEILQQAQKKPFSIFTLVRFGDLEKYSFIRDKNIEIIAPFNLETFGLVVPSQPKDPNYKIFTVRWEVRYSKPNYFYRVPKSAPIVDNTKVYFGSDDGVMRALLQESGMLVWEFKIFGLGSAGKTIFSSPALFDDTLYFGAYDGNFYALDAKTGKKKWVYMDADWVGSSPCIAEDLGLVYVGLEFGLWNKKGGIVALDAKTGKKKWEYITMPEMTHGSPAYSKKFKAVVIGSNDGCAYFFRANDGKLLWKLQTEGPIRASFSFDEKRGRIAFGSFDGTIYVVDIKNGNVLFTLQTGVGIYSTPLIVGNDMYVSGLDKKIYCINLDMFTVNWEFTTSGRLFGSPAMINNVLYVGSNDGRLYELDPSTGTNTGILQLTERITNKITYNKKTGYFFLLTYANEIYCLEHTKSV